MAVPDFQSLALPLLQVAADGLEHPLADARNALAAKFQLSATDIEEMLPSGRQSRFSNRVAWAKSYMQQAGLLTTPRRGQFQITERGRAVLADPPERIDIKFLERFTEFAEFRSRHGEESSADLQPAADPGSETPEEALESAYATMRASLAADVLARVKAGSDKFFEQLVVELLLKMGYGESRSESGRVVGRSGDEGIDGIISEDRLGLDVVYLQAKKWEGTVGRPEIQKFVGALHGKRAKKGVFITTSSFSAEAVAYVEHIDPRVVLIDGHRLAEFMVDFEVGVATSRTYHAKRVDSDYFEES